MAIIKGLETKFNEVHVEYDKWRPTYISELYKDIMDFNEINEFSNVLEIGIGTGQATLPILEKGCLLTAIELGDKLAEFTKEKFSKHKNFDMIYSATAFHWIPEEIGYPKVYKMLKSGGIFARFANHPYKDKGNQELDIAIQEVYSKYMPTSTLSPEYGEKQCEKMAEGIKKYGFIDVNYKLYHRTRTFNAKEYVSLINTYSNHRALEENKRSEFYKEIENAIDNYGGKITIYDTIDLQLARKP